MVEWRDVLGYEGYYMVNSDGEVKSLDRYVKQWRGGLKPVKGRVLKPFNNKGYHQVEVCIFGKRKKKSVHRLVCESFLPNPEAKPQINHIDGVKTNNKLENLEWCTSKENMNHARDNGLWKGASPRGGM